MKNKSGWLIIVLISSVQLAMLLIAVLVLFSWFSSKTEETVRNQVCGDNQIIARYVVSESKAAGIRDIRDRNSKDYQRLASIVSRIEMPNNGFICIVDSLTGMTICPLAGETNFTKANLADVIFYPIRSGSNSEPSALLDTISNRLDQRTALGRMEFKGFDHFVSAEYLPQINSILVVGQQRNSLIAKTSGAMMYAKRIVFAVTLSIGIACLGMFLSILNRQEVQAKSVEKGLEKQVSRRERELVQTQNAVIFGLAKLAESRDNDTGDHLDRIKSYVTILASDLASIDPEIDEAFVNNLALASSLHDIGKVGIPDSILLKPGRLSVEEREVMELHTLIGGECLEAIQARLGYNNVFMHTARQVAYYHHEKWTGEGYPHGLREEEIPLVARIVAVADVYDALTSKRPYKQPMSHLESKSIILSGSGSHFDPEIVSAFLRHEDKFESISRNQLELTDDDVRSEFQALCERAHDSEDVTETLPS